MIHKRNTEGLKKAAQERRQNTIKRVEQTIKSLLKENREINFNCVSKLAKVGKPWLYKEENIRSKIEALRLQTQHINEHKKANSSQRASEKSKDSIIKMLKERIHLLETENKKLKEQIEVIYGEIYTAKG